MAELNALLPRPAIAYDGHYLYDVGVRQLHAFTAAAATPPPVIADGCRWRRHSGRRRDQDLRAVACASSLAPRVLYRTP
jgi:hypothetical protein